MVVLTNKDSSNAFLQPGPSHLFATAPKAAAGSDVNSSSAFQFSEEGTSQSFWASDPSSGNFGNWNAPMPPRTPSYYATAPPPPPPAPPVQKRSWMPPPPPPRRLVDELTEEGRPDPTGTHYRIFLRWYAKTAKVEHFYVPDSHRCPPRGGNYSFEEWCFLTATWWTEHFAHLQQRVQRNK